MTEKIKVCSVNVKKKKIFFFLEDLTRNEIYSQKKMSSDDASKILSFKVILHRCELQVDEEYWADMASAPKWWYHWFRGLAKMGYRPTHLSIPGYIESWHDNRDTFNRLDVLKLIRSKTSSTTPAVVQKRAQILHLQSWLLLARFTHRLPEDIARRHCICELRICRRN